MFDNPLKPIVDLWLAKIQNACDAKKDRFGRDAEILHWFYNHAVITQGFQSMSGGDAGFLSDMSFGSNGRPVFPIEVNKVFEAVALLAPALYHQYPEVNVDPVRRPFIPPQMRGIDVSNPLGQRIAMQLQQQHEMEFAGRKVYGDLKSFYLNWLQVEANKKEHSRAAIREATVKGLGTVWTEMYRPPGSSIKYPRSRYRSCDDFIKDPDAKYDEDVQWIGLYNLQPNNVVEDRFGLPYGTLKGHYQSKNQQSVQAMNQQYYGNQSPTTDSRNSYDLTGYWEIWSKNGFGERLKPTTTHPVKTEIDTSVFGDYTYTVVAHGVPYPLNLPTQVLGQEDPRLTYMRTQWPIPFWMDGGWPVSELSFYRDPNSVWPISLIKPAIGEIRFVNWCMSFLADKVAASCTTYIGVMKDAATEIREQLESPNSPYKMIEIARLTGNSIQQVVSFLQAPEFPQHIWAMVAQVMQIIDKKTGITELLHGLTATQMRSATEADVRQSNLQIRPDDMAASTEDWLSQTAKKEALAACWMNSFEDWLGPLGPEAAAVMTQYVQSQEFDRVARDYDYRIVADSARKPNRQQKLNDLYEMGRVAGPVLQQFAMIGMVNPWNAYVADICELLGLDASRYVVDTQQMAMMQQQQGPTEDERKAQAKEEQRQIDLRFKALEHDLSLLQQQQTHEEEFDHTLRMNDEELDFARRQHAIQVQNARSARRNGTAA